jgi:hypothetical protein
MVIVRDDQVAVEAVDGSRIVAYKSAETRTDPTDWNPNLKTNYDCLLFPAGLHTGLQPPFRRVALPQHELGRFLHREASSTKVRHL